MTVLPISPVYPSRGFDLPLWVRIGSAGASALLLGLCIFAFGRWMLGYAPQTPWVRELALTIHLLTVIPAIPLGAYVMLSQKGSQQHRMLGKIWLSLMFVTAISTIFIRNVNDGQFSWIHLFTLLTMIAVPQAIISARQGKIESHKKHLRNFFIGALIVAGLTAFAPGRTMWQWAFGHPTLHLSTD
ncbi:MAG: DUF2306 domain-containing protein [Sphingomonadales bacterium]|nr:DUF2306 domain-containing protein [Sphingomonadales bacterium]NCO50405.1 DUF2306 domain-containing protein [Sphingomonadales bacterium]NCP00593.1 DUF2306 domain-containing protein [Sphingomonadales bacterium]NCP26873.1 DUF2306 domain-containing protein [Sphingomonadales bacterium]NCP44485.1 DUF2306 domain-containing protein [Sphingomonadales bacterium]